MINEILRARREFAAFQSQYLTALLARLDQEAAAALAALDELNARGVRSVMRSEISTSESALRQYAVRLRADDVPSDVATIILAQFAVNQSQAAATLADLERRVARLLESVQTHRSRGNYDHVSAYDGRTSQGRLLVRALSEPGVRHFVPERDPKTCVHMLDDPAWPTGEALVKVHPTAICYLARADNDEVVLGSFTPDRPSAIAGEIELDQQFAGVMKLDRGLWFENFISAELAKTLREETLHSRLFTYEFDGQWIAVRLSIFPQRGSAEERLGDFGLVVERLDLDPAHPERCGIGAVEAKLRGYDDGKLHSLRKKQATTILGNFPKAKLLIYDRSPSVISGHATCLPLADYARLRPGTTYDGSTLHDWIPFSSQLLRRFFVGEDLVFDPVVVDEGFARRSHFMEFAVAAVAIGNQRDQVERALRRPGPLERQFVQRLSREYGLPLHRESGRERGGLDRGR